MNFIRSIGITLVLCLFSQTVIPDDGYSAARRKPRKTMGAKAPRKPAMASRVSKPVAKKRPQPQSNLTPPLTRNNKKLIDDAIVKTGPQRKDGAIFWTQGGMNQAEDMANRLNKKHPETKHSSLEMIANKPPLSLPNGMATPKQGTMWKAASDGFAESASGKTRMVMGPGQWRDQNVFNTVEKPVLTRRPSQGGKVTQINVFETNPSTGKLEKTHRWYNDGSPWDGPGSQPGGDWKRNLAPKK